MNNLNNQDGSYVSKIDSRGRMYLPADLRKRLACTEFYINVSSHNYNLKVFTPDAWDKLVSKISETPIENQRRLRSVFVHACLANLQSKGYIKIPEKLRELQNISGHVALKLTDDGFEIWDEEIYEIIREKQLEE